MTRSARWTLRALGACVGLASSVAIAPLAAQTAPPSATLLPGKGAALTMAKCAICHEIGHVTRSRLTRAEWEDNIKVMIARGMPIEPGEIAIVLEYLAAYYNRDKPQPANAEADDAAPAGSAPDALLAAHGCVACHAADRKIVGPSFREIGGRYRSDGSAAAKLAQKVKEGGAGTWGTVPMPPHPQVSDADLSAMITWVLQQQ